MGCCCTKHTEDVHTPSHIHVPTQSSHTWRQTIYPEEKIKEKNSCFCCKCFTICGRWSGLTCCCCNSIEAQPFLSIKKDRHCTDIPCCVLLMFTMCVELALAYYAIAIIGADPRWLVYYSDLNGEICAPTYDNFDMLFNSSTGGNYAAWPDIRMYDIRICVDHCNDTLTDDRIVTPSFDADLDIDIDNVTAVTVDISGYQSINILDAICIPDPEYASEIASTLLDDDYKDFESNFDTFSDQISLAINDVSTAWMLFILTAISALFVSMLWGVLIRRIGSFIIWVSIFFTISGVGIVAYYLIEWSEFAYLFGYTTIGDIMYYTGYTLAILDVMFVLAICAVWNRIRLAIALVKETTRVLTSIWTLFFYPIVPFITFLLFMTYWIISGVYMASVTMEKEYPIPLGYKVPYYEGGPTLQTKLNLPDSNATYIYLEIDDTWQYICLFHFFVLLWIINFISYHTYMVIAGVYAEWYFANWKDSKQTSKSRGSGSEQLSYCPVFASFIRVTFYHLGTIAFGSLLIAIIEFIEYTLNYFEKKFLKSNKSPLQKIVLAVVKCILRCVKCILDKINKNGLIITSIYGWPFCAASMKGVTIILKNVVRATTLSMVSGYLEKLGKICILSFNVGIVMTFATYYYGDELSSIILPAIICFIITYVICWQYMHLYEVGISAIFICFLIDEQINKSFDTMKASKRLTKIIGANKNKLDVEVSHDENNGSKVSEQLTTHIVANKPETPNTNDENV